MCRKWYNKYMEIILYVVDLKEKIEISYINKKESYNKRFDKFINELCIRYLSTFNGRKEAFKKIFGYRYNVPIFVCDKILFIKVNNIMWINVYQVKEVFRKEKDIVLILSNNEIIFIKNGHNKITKKITEIKKVFSYIEKM